MRTGATSYLLSSPLRCFIYIYRERAIDRGRGREGYIYTHTHTYICRERERERGRERERERKRQILSTQKVGGGWWLSHQEPLVSHGVVGQNVSPQNAHGLRAKGGPDGAGCEVEFFDRRVVHETRLQS